MLAAIEQPGISGRGILDEDSDEDKEKDEESVLDTTNLEGIEAAGVENIIDLVRTKLPNVNSAFGRTRCLGKIVKHLVLHKQLPEAFPTQTLGQISKKNYDCLKATFASYCEGEIALAAMKAALQRCSSGSNDQQDRPQELRDQSHCSLGMASGLSRCFGVVGTIGHKSPSTKDPGIS